MLIVGNKIDLYHQRHVSMEKVQKTIVEQKYKYVEISAKTGEGMDELQ